MMPPIPYRCSPCPIRAPLLGVALKTGPSAPETAKLTPEWLRWVGSDRCPRETFCVRYPILAAADRPNHRTS